MRLLKSTLLLLHSLLLLLLLFSSPRLTELYLYPAGSNLSSSCRGHSQSGKARASPLSIFSSKGSFKQQHWAISVPMFHCCATHRLGKKHRHRQRRRHRHRLGDETLDLNKLRDDSDTESSLETETDSDRDSDSTRTIQRYSSILRLFRELDGSVDVLCMFTVCCFTRSLAFLHPLAPIHQMISFQLTAALRSRMIYFTELVFKPRFEVESDFPRMSLGSRFLKSAAEKYWF